MRSLRSLRSLERPWHLVLWPITAAAFAIGATLIVCGVVLVSISAALAGRSS